MTMNSESDAGRIKVSEVTAQSDNISSSDMWIDMFFVLYFIYMLPLLVVVALQ